MKLATDQSSQSTVQTQLKDFLVIEAQKQRFQALVHSLTDLCWDICMDKPTPRLQDKTIQCMHNCVDRFIDTTYFITTRIQNGTTFPEIGTGSSLF